MRRWIHLLGTLALALALTGAGHASRAEATTTVSKSQRELVIVSPDLSQGNLIEQGLYTAIGWGGVILPTATLALRYSIVTILKDEAATRGGFVNRLRDIASKSTIRAVDVIFVTHGLSGNVLFSNGSFTMASVRDRILANLTATQRAKLRMVFSTACYGASHRQAWRDAGFKTVSGSRGVYADSVASYQPFLTAWVSGLSFGTGVAAANTAGSFSTWDATAAAWLFAKGSQRWDEVDSFRLTSGNTGLTIGTMP